MVLADLGKKINAAFSSLNPVSYLDEPAVDALLKAVCNALLESDVNVKLVSNLRTKVKAKVLPQLNELAKNQQQGSSSDSAGVGNKGRQIVQKAIYDELVALVDPGEVSFAKFKPRKGATNVIMFVGLQGAGKTTSCTKLAVHYQRRGLKTALVCADTFRAGAFDQLKQNAVKAKIPFFGSYTETDPSAIAQEGVEKFRKDRFDIIIVDTSGRHRQESELFEEMKDIARAVEPNLTVMVLDGAIGQAAESQSRAFKEASGFGAIIVTKLDGHARGGGAISAVAATKTPIIFIGTGEHLHDLEKFSPGPFISKMLGMGDMRGLMEQAEEMALANPERQENLMKKLEKGEFTIRDMKEQMATIMGMGPLGKIAGMIPGMSQMLGAGGEEEAGKRMKRMIFIFDSMTTEELDSDGSMFYTKGKGASKALVPAGKEKEKENEKPDEPALAEGAPREPNRRVLRVARGSGTSVNEVEELLAQHVMFAGMVKKAGGKSGWMSKLKQSQGAAARGGRGGPPLGPNGMPDLSKMTPGQLAQLQSMMPAGMREQMQQPGAMEAAMNMMKQMGGGGGFPGMGGGMPDMSKLMGMMGGGGR